MSDSCCSLPESRPEEAASFLAEISSVLPAPGGLATTGLCACPLE
ncbi:MAG: hypothetical protein RBS68_09425 [Anaerolineales bacterium]|nr:hypothetical protein [Anaerolineales bacterium]